MRRTPVAIVAVVALVGIGAAVGILALRGGEPDSVPGDRADPKAIAVAEQYLDAFADADVEALCDTYDAPSREQALARYDAKDCAAYATAYMADQASGYSVTRLVTAEFELGEATGTAKRVEVPFTGSVTYAGNDPAAIDYYRDNPTVAGRVVVVHDSDTWRVNAEATQATF